MKVPKSECSGYLNSIKVTQKGINTPMIRHPTSIAIENTHTVLHNRTSFSSFFKKSFVVKVPKVSEGDTLAA